MNDIIYIKKQEKIYIFLDGSILNYGILLFCE